MPTPIAILPVDEVHDLVPTRLDRDVRLDGTCGDENPDAPSNFQFVQFEHGDEACLPGPSTPCGSRNLTPTCYGRGVTGFGRVLTLPMTPHRPPGSARIG